MAAHYSEWDPYAAQWLRNLIAAGHIAPGDVDERSIVDVRADDLRGYTQCHFFAGLGGWSHAPRLAGWPDDRPVWTGSCPCQPFSAAGAGQEFGDARHLWPAWFRLIGESRPDAIFGEQVSSKDALAWFDHVRSDLEGAGYAVGVLDTCAAGVGAPHIRQRLYFVADAVRDATRQHARELSGDEGQHGFRSAHGNNGPWDRGAIVGLADGNGHGRNQGRLSDTSPGDDGALGNGGAGELANPSQRGLGIDRGASGLCGHIAQRDAIGWMGDAEGANGRRELATGSARSGRPGFAGAGSIGDVGDTADLGRATVQPVETQSGRGGNDGLGQVPTAGIRATNGFWRDAEWLPCRDGKARPVEPGTFPLATGVSARVGRLRAYGNSIVATQAAEFVSAYVSIAP